LEFGLSKSRKLSLYSYKAGMGFGRCQNVRRSQDRVAASGRGAVSYLEIGDAEEESPVLVVVDRIEDLID
jgi:hypothetical protein